VRVMEPDAVSKAQILVWPASFSLELKGRQRTTTCTFSGDSFGVESLAIEKLERREVILF
jgi:hypothetical protein